MNFVKRSACGNPGDVKSPSKTHSWDHSVGEIKRRTKKNAATESGAASAKMGGFGRSAMQFHQAGLGRVNGGRLARRLAAAWANGQVERAADANEQRTEEQGDPTEQGKINGHAEHSLNQGGGGRHDVLVL